MGKKRSVYDAKSAKAIEAIPKFPTTIVDLIVGYLVNQPTKNYSVYAPGPFQVPEFDFLYNKKEVFLNCPAPTPIATINGIVLTNQVDCSLLQSLLKMAKPWFATELEETVGKSSDLG